MKDAAALVQSYLLTVTALTDIVGSRVYIDEAPSGVRDANIVVYRLGGDDLSEAMVMARPIVQVSCFASEKAQSKTLAQLVIDELGDRQQTVDGTWVISRYQNDRIFRASGWWHASVDIALRYRA